ncbi:MAG: hypothetical protein MJ090_00305 [Clostridia bacterium]|nr:hypothetical protein [Clostridia bacterium]
MKYPSIKKQKSETKKIAFSGGINNSIPNTDICDNQFSSALNVIKESGVLRTRDSIIARSESIIGDYEETGIMHTDLTVTDTEIFEYGMVKRVAYNVWGSIDFQKINIYSVSDSSLLKKLGTISLGLTEGHLYALDNIFFVVGKKNYGNGLYAFLKRKSKFAGSDHFIYDIYEYSPNSSVFIKMSKSEYYTPVIYINGRGTQYEEAKEAGWVFENAPACPEEINLLGGKFCAYYTSDGISSTFKLPVTELAYNDDVVCRIYDIDSNYTEWEIPPGSFEDTATFNNLQIKLVCDKGNGRLSFWKGNERYSIPRCDLLNGNNICFSAAKRIDKSEEMIIGSKSATAYNSDFYFFGNSEKKNEVFVSKFETPLYFPETMRTSVGNPTDDIVAVKPFKDKLLAIKSEGIFKLSSAGETGKLTYISPVGTTRDFQKPQRLSSSTLSTVIGTNLYKTICTCGNKMVWLFGNRIYALQDNNTVKEISGPINKSLSSFTDSACENAFAVSYEGFYYLFIGNKVFALNFDTESFGLDSNYFDSSKNNSNISWYYLELPDEQLYCGAICGLYNIFIICADKGKTINYFSHFGGKCDKKDIVIVNRMEKEKSIPFSITTKDFDFDTHLGKNIISLNLQMAGDSTISIDVKGDSYHSKQSVKLKDNTLNDIKVFPFFMPIHKMNFTVSGEGQFTVKKANIEYNIL